nr:MAG TPA: hypothetical protein [Caudoviricetes sp.]
MPCATVYTKTSYKSTCAGQPKEIYWGNTPLWLINYTM